MAKTCSHDGNRDSSVEHLSRHEATQVVQSKMPEASGPPHRDEPLRDEVGQPRTRARRVPAEDEPVFAYLQSATKPCPVSFEKFHAGCVESDPIGATGLGGYKKRTVASTHR
jgi:hypothetical protein